MAALEVQEAAALRLAQDRLRELEVTKGRLGLMAGELATLKYAF